MDRLAVERRLKRLEKLLQAASKERRRVHLALEDAEFDRGDRWARMMLGVLEDLDDGGAGGSMLGQPLARVEAEHCHLELAFPMGDLGDDGAGLDGND